MEQALSPSVVNQYCALLFGPAYAASPEFLEALDPGTLKAAYRKRALLTHPDRAGILGRDEAHLAEDFKRLVSAYRALSTILESERELLLKSARDIRSTVKNAAYQAAFNAARNAARNAAFRSQRTQSAQQPRPDRYYQGVMPKRTLMFAEYLYYTGAISWRELINSLVWQRRERPRIGEIAVRWDLLTPEKVQVINSMRGVRERFGETAVRRGYLSQFWVNTLLKGQQMLQHPIGQFFVGEGLLTRQELFVNLARQRQHNRIYTPLD